MAYAAYDNYRTPQTVARRTVSTHSNYPYSGLYEDYTRYPYGEPTRGGYDEPYSSQYGEAYQQPGYSSYSNSRTNPYHGTGAYDEYTDGTEYDYTAYNAAIGANNTAVAPGALTTVPSRRRASSMSYSLSSGPYRGSTYYDGGFSSRRTLANGSAPPIKFRMKGALRSGITLQDAVAGAKLSGGDYVKWHEINADARGRIHLRVKWNGYSALTYEIPVDGYENRVRLSSLLRRVARACIHFMQSNGIPITWDRVKLYHLEEVSYGTWQPALTVR